MYLKFVDRILGEMSGFRSFKNGTERSAISVEPQFAVSQFLAPLGRLANSSHPATRFLSNRKETTAAHYSPV